MKVPTLLYEGKECLVKYNMVLYTKETIIGLTWYLLNSLHYTIEKIVPLMVVVVVVFPFLKLTTLTVYSVQVLVFSNNSKKQP